MHRELEFVGISGAFVRDPNSARLIPGRVLVAADTGSMRFVPNEGHTLQGAEEASEEPVEVS